MDRGARREPRRLQPYADPLGVTLYATRILDVTPSAFRWRAAVEFPEGWRVMLRMAGTRTG